MDKHGNVSIKDRVRGSLFGGAVGDALGYAIEFDSEKEIFHRYGPEGITEYELHNGKALISDDTQMTLFTANGILIGQTGARLRGIGGLPRGYVLYAYLDWLKTQNSTMKKVKQLEKEGGKAGNSWLLDVPELYKLRAPGNTCLSALQARAGNASAGDFIKDPINNSKGCGGIMRIAPLALRYRVAEGHRPTIQELDREAAQLAAITHGHSLGYMPAAVVSHIISRILETENTVSLKAIVLDARDTVAELFAGDPYLGTLLDMINQAVYLSESESGDDLTHIHQLGEGWVAEETLGIALYCALKYQDDFSKAMIVSVNHKGDSDSTGAVTGNILGAWIGYEAMEEKWKKDLELADVILEMADDLYQGCLMSEYGEYQDPAWIAKYVRMHRYQVKSEHEGESGKEPYGKRENVVEERKNKTSAERGCTFFWHDNQKNGEFSNWYQREFVIDDFRYFCVEQYMMSQKAKLFHDSHRYTAILRANNPKVCKALGKQVTPYDDKAWSKVKYEVVKAGNRAKFEQNPDLKQLLLATGDTILAEASPWDAIWGIGVDENTARRMKPEEWPGKNMLGNVLMELREEFASREENHSFSKETEIRMILGDITKQRDVDAIVNAARPSLLGGGGVDGAIHRAAGPELLAECKTLNGCNTGEAKITKAYRIPCRAIIHTVGPVWKENDPVTERWAQRMLRECYRKSLKLAAENGIRRIAFPSISTGAYHFPLEMAAEIAVATALNFVETNPGVFDRIEWVLFDEGTLAAYQNALTDQKNGNL